MTPTEIGLAYDRITHLWQNQSFDQNNGIEQHKKAIAFTQSRGKALDVGCGCTGRLIDLLLDLGFEPEGIDISVEMIDLARQKQPTVKFYHEDICEWDIIYKYDFITAWDSLWHIPLNQQRKVLTKLLTSLNPNGVLIFSGGGTDNEDEHKNDFMGVEVSYSSLGINGFLQLFIELGCICRHLEYDQYPELHTCFIVQKV